MRVTEFLLKRKLLLFGKEANEVFFFFFFNLARGRPQERLSLRGSQISLHQKVTGILEWDPPASTPGLKKGQTMKERD
jgi:hypothetical protein